jgi:hypothetical protein
VPDILRNLIGLLLSSLPITTPDLSAFSFMVHWSHDRVFGLDDMVTHSSFCEKKDNWPAGAQPMIFAKEEPPR